MTVLCLVRHGESAGNAENKYSGEYDHQLTNLGVNQAEKCGIKLQSYEFDLMYSSQLSRAIATAQLIINSNIKGCSDWRRLKILNERRYGIAENKSKLDLLEIYNENIICSWHNSLNSSPAQGETIFNLYKRTLEFYETELIDQISEKNILIVAHAGIIKCLVTIIEDKKLVDIPKITVQNAIPIVYEF